MKRILAAFLFVAALGTSARATVLDLQPTEGLFGLSYLQDGYVFSNAAGGSSGLGNWIALGQPSFNANGNNPTIFQNFAGTTNKITTDDGALFNFLSIDLANVYNNGGGGDVLFTFNYAGGGSNSTTVTLLSGITGLQTFTFNQLAVVSVMFTPLTTQGPWIQYDNVGLSAYDVSQVPLPGALILFLSGLGGIGSFSWFRRWRTSQLLAA